MSVRSATSPVTPMPALPMEALSPVEDIERHHQFMLKLEARGLELAQERRRIDLELQVVDAQLDKEKVIHKDLMDKILNQTEHPGQSSRVDGLPMRSPLPTQSPVHTPQPPTPQLVVPFHDLSRGHREPVLLKSRTEAGRPRSPSVPRRRPRDVHREDRREMGGDRDRRRRRSRSGRRSRE